MKIISNATLRLGFSLRFPNAGSGTVESLSASAGTVPALEAAAVKGFAAVSGKLQWVKASEHFYVAGEPVLIGDFVQVEELDAKRLAYSGRAVFATDDEVRAAQSPTAKGKA